MKNYRPLLLRELEVRLPGCRVRRLRLNRHLPDVDTLSEHAHGYSQIFVYVRGSGTLRVAGQAQPVGPGTAAFLPPRTVHAFEETARRRPICLVIDLEWRGAKAHGARVIRLPASQLSTIRGVLSEMLALGDPGQFANRLTVSAATLRLVDVVMRGMGVLPAPERRPSALQVRVEREIERAGADVPVAAVAAALGYQADYLNRAFKRATGLSVREFRDAQRLAAARLALRRGLSVGAAAAEVGFVDLNYFCRWFKKGTGLTPGAYRAGGGKPGDPAPNLA